MTTSNGEVVRQYFDSVLNDHNAEAFFDFVHEDAVFRGSAYVGLGIGFDSTENNRVVVGTVFDQTPASGQIMPGDEIIHAEDATRTWETFDDLNQGFWGRGKPGTWVRLTVLRDGKEVDVELERAVIEGATFDAQTASKYVADWVNRLYPDVSVELIDIIEEGDVVACYSRNSGTNSEHNQFAIWESVNFLRVQDDKIVEGWGIDDTLSELMQTGHRVEKSTEEVTHR